MTRSTGDPLVTSDIPLIKPKPREVPFGFSSVIIPQIQLAKDERR
jgi:hypothetical protein